MTGQFRTDRAFWQDVLLAGGATSIPRWTLAPRPGMGEHRERLAPTTWMRRCSGSRPTSPIPLGTVVLAAHARVLAALSGEMEVVAGYVAAPGERPVPFRVSVSATTWRDLLGDVREVESELLAHAGYPVEALREELGLPEPFETVLDPTGAPATVDGPIGLAVGLEPTDDGHALVLRYRTDVIDADAAARIAGYHVAALTRLAADPDAEHGSDSLISDAERRLQIEGLAGPARALPDRRFHELFAERAAADPDAVAAIHGSDQLTYGELDERAGRIAGALRARGLAREGVVAVVSDRDLDWMAAVVAILRAGGVYLPIEPSFPAERIAAILARAGCELVLTAPGRTETLESGARVDARRPDGPDRGGRCRGASRGRPRRPRRRLTSSPTSTSRPARPASRRARCASTPACSTTSTRRSTTSGSSRARSSRRPLR